MATRKKSGKPSRKTLRPGQRKVRRSGGKVLETATTRLPTGWDRLAQDNVVAVIDGGAVASSDVLKGIAPIFRKIKEGVARRQLPPRGSLDAGGFVLSWESTRGQLTRLSVEAMRPTSG